MSAVRQKKAQLVVLASLAPARRRFAGRCWRRVAMLVAVAAMVYVRPEGPACADEAEPLLFLGIQRSTTIDKLASQMVVEHLKERRENLLEGSALTDTERRCRRPQCLAPLATQRKAALVLDGDVQQVGSNRSLRVIMHLYDSRQRQQQELENLCVDCDETKLGIVLTNTTTDLLGQYRKAAAAMDQLAALLDATPAGLQDTGQSATQAASAPTNNQTAPTSPTAQTAQTAAPATAPATKEPVQAPPTASPTPAVPGPSQAGPADSPRAYPTPMPPLPAVSSSDPLAGRSTADKQGAKKGLSTKRKAIAAVSGALGASAILAAFVLNVLDQSIASNYTYNPKGSPCIDPQYAGQLCVYSTIRLWAPGYAVGGLLLGGMILTLSLPEHNR